MDITHDSSPVPLETNFDFFQHWYPIALLEDLDPKRPTPITLLGQHYVIWQPRDSNQFLVFHDQCPHRLAPLSEGRIDEQTGQLMCSYHGWQFNAEGHCTHIPQAETVTSKESQQYCVVALPTQQENGLLWVWPDLKTRKLASTQLLPTSPFLDASKGFIWSSVMRDLAYDWQTLIENVADPSHVPFAHHGIQGNRKKASPMPMKILHSSVDLIEVQTTGKFITHISFEPPCRLEYRFELGEGRQAGMVTYCIPISPGRSRIVALFPRNFAKGLNQFIPRWFEHIKTRNSVLDGDMILLYHQERQLLQQTQSKNWQFVYRLPTSADRLVIEYRKWFDKYCQGQMPWQQPHGQSFLGPASCDRTQILDRYHQHTLICSSCRGALHNIQLLQKVLVSFFVITVTGVAVLPDPIRTHWGIPLILFALLALSLFAWLRYWLEPRFRFVDYVHANH